MLAAFIVEVEAALKAMGKSTPDQDSLSLTDALPMLKIITTFLNMVILAETPPPALCRNRVPKSDEVADPSQLRPICFFHSTVLPAQDPGVQVGTRVSSAASLHSKCAWMVRLSRESWPHRDAMMQGVHATIE